MKETVRSLLKLNIYRLYEKVRQVTATISVTKPNPIIVYLESFSAYILPKMKPPAAPTRMYAMLCSISSSISPDHNNHLACARFGVIVGVVLFERFQRVRNSLNDTFA